MYPWVICICGRPSALSPLSEHWKTGRSGWSNLPMALSFPAARAKRERSTYNLLACVQRTLFLGEAERATPLGSQAEAPSCHGEQHPPCVFSVHTKATLLSTSHEGGAVSLRGSNKAGRGLATHRQCLTFGLVPCSGEGRGTLMGAYLFSGASSRGSSCPLCSTGAREERSSVSTYGVE